jgi:hypothetical protein
MTYEYITELGRTNFGDDSEPLMRANQEVAKARLEAIEPGSVHLSHERTWACAIVAFKVDFSDNGEALRAELNKILDELQDYPALDESLWLKYEFEANHPEADNLCYAEDDCACGQAKA